MTREEAKQKFWDLVLRVPDIDLRHELRLAAVDYAHAAAMETIYEITLKTQEPKTESHQ